MIIPGPITRNLFFTGKGGVGKTTVASATAVELADSGKRVLLVSTDPASNLDEVLGVTLTSQPTPVERVAGLSALNVDPEAAARAYRERMVGPYRGFLPDASIRSMEEQFSGACTVEIAAFDEFAMLLGNPAATADFDHVIFDTAPTGHTLRLLQLPAAWTVFLDANVGGNSCLGPLSGLTEQRALYAGALEALSNPEKTTVVLVARPDEPSLAEAERAGHELSELGVRSQRLVVNGVFTSSVTGDSLADARAARSREGMRTMPAHLAMLPMVEIPLRPFALIGVEGLRRFADPSAAPPVACGPDDFGKLPQPLDVLVADLRRAGHGVVMTMGKGGVGKTTLATRIAIALARSGETVHLSTTDPAAHLDPFLPTMIPNLTVSRIDPERETAEYSQEVMATAGQGLDDQGRALLEEDLRSPCTEEIAVFRAFARTVAQGGDRFVVLDTAPTGHTLLLLDATEAYHRDVLRNASGSPEEVRELLPRLRDRDYTRVLLVTLAEATPVHEAAALQADLERAGITPYAWVINQSLAPLTTTDPVLQALRDRERPYIEEVRDRLATRVALVPWEADSTSKAPLSVRGAKVMAGGRSGA
jgi:arsenite-transporting ATPase